MAPEFELMVKQKSFIYEIHWLFGTEWSYGVSLLKLFCLPTNSNSDVIFVFPEVDLDNRILISSQDSDLGFSRTLSTSNRSKFFQRHAGPTAWITSWKERLKRCNTWKNRLLFLAKNFQSCFREFPGMTHNFSPGMENFR